MSIEAASVIFGGSGIIVGIGMATAFYEWLEWRRRKRIERVESTYIDDEGRWVSKDLMIALNKAIADEAMDK